MQRMRTRAERVEGGRVEGGGGGGAGGGGRALCNDARDDSERRARGPGRRPLSLDLAQLARRAFALPRRSHNWRPRLLPWMEPERDEDVIMMNLQVMTFRAVG